MGILTSRNSCAILVGVRGLEPPTSASRTLRASRLRYTPVGQTVQVIHHRPYPTQIGLYSLSASLARHCCQAIPNTSPTEGKYNIIGQALTMGEKCRNCSDLTQRRCGCQQGQTLGERIEVLGHPGSEKRGQAHAGPTAFGTARAAADLASDNQRANTALRQIIVRGNTRNGHKDKEFGQKAFDALA